MDAARIKPGESNTRKLLAALAERFSRGVSIAEFFRGFGGHHLVKKSSRSADQIIGDVRAFYEARPRPWRWHGNNAKRQRLQKGGRTWRQ